MGSTESSTPVASSDRDDGELGEDDSTTDGGSNFLGALDTETDVAIKVTDGDESLETSALTGTGLLLDRHDLHDLILKLGKEEVDDLVLLDGEREEVDLFHGPDLAILDETTELGDGDPGAKMKIRVLIQITRGRTTPCPRPCGHHAWVHGDPFHAHHDHGRSHLVLVRNQPYFCTGKPGQQVIRDGVVQSIAS